MKFVEWKTYRTRFLVQAKQLNSALSFVDPLGRTHCGRRGDYLVESSDGVISIAPRQIFEDIYVEISAADEGRASERSDEQKSVEAMVHENSIGENGTGDGKLAPGHWDKKTVDPAKLHRSARGEKVCACPTRQLNLEPLNMEEIEQQIERPPVARRPATSSRDLSRDEPARVRRKLPQPADVRTPHSRLGLM